ncbi:MAG: hypothetical protein ABI548_13820 [Polyangiaceae bacterium]
MRAVLGAAVLSGVLMSSGTVAAEQPAPASAQAILVQPVTCGELPWSVNAWLELLRVELSADGIEVRSADANLTSESPVVAVEPTKCDQTEGTATLTFVSGDIRLTRNLDLADVEPIARPRVVAIALADLIRSGVVAQAPPPAAPSSPIRLDVHIQLEAPVAPPPLVLKPLVLKPLAPASSLALFAAAETSLFARDNAGLLGARGGVPIQPIREAALVIDANALAGSARDPLGEIRETVATLGVSLLGTGGTHGASFGVGPRLEAGVGWFRGHATGPLVRASSTSSPLVFLSLSAIASFPIWAPFSGFMGFDIGTSLYGFSARADQHEVSNLGGPTLSVRTGFLWNSAQR